MKMIKVFLIAILISTISVSTAEAAKENFDRSKPHVNPADKEKADGLATGKRQHKPVNVKNKEKALKHKQKLQVKKKEKKEKKKRGAKKEK